MFWLERQRHEEEIYPASWTNINQNIFSLSLRCTEIYSIQFRLMKGFRCASGGIDVNEACVARDEGENENFIFNIFFKQCAFNSVRSSFTSGYVWAVLLVWGDIAIYNVHIKLAALLSESDKCFKYWWRKVCLHFLRNYNFFFSFF